MNSNDYVLLVNVLFSQAHTYASAYRWQLEINPDNDRLLSDLLNSYELLYDIIRSSNHEDDYRAWVKRNFEENDILKT